MTPPNPYFPMDLMHRERGGGECVLDYIGFSATTTARSLNVAARRCQLEVMSAGTMHDGNQRIRADDLQI